jgi:hypothetical protein
MEFVYFLAGVLIPTLILQISKMTKKGVFKRKRRINVDKTNDLEQIRAELNNLTNTVSDLRDDMKHLQEVNTETQKTNVLLYPENFDKDKSDGKTVFVKNGEEKPYETIDWRSR